MTDQLLAPVSPVTWHAAISTARPGAGRAVRTAPVPVRNQVPGRDRDQAPAAGPAAATGAAAATRSGTARPTAGAVPDTADVLAPDVTRPDVTGPEATGPAAAMPAAGAGTAGTPGERPWTVARRPRRVAPLPCQLAPDLFFAERPEDLKQAQELCQACPVRQECLAGALERGEPCGVWGGKMFLYGNIIDKKRPRGRPRRVAA